MDGKGVRWRVFYLEEAGNCELRRGSFLLLIFSLFQNFNPRLHNLVCAAAFWIGLPPARCRAWAVECVLFLRNTYFNYVRNTCVAYGHQSPHVVSRYHRTSKEHAFRATHPYTRVSERVMREVKEKKKRWAHSIAKQQAPARVPFSFFFVFFPFKFWTKTLQICCNCVGPWGSIEW